MRRKMCPIFLMIALLVLSCGGGGGGGMNGQLLVVDDEAGVRDMLSRHFRLLGYGVQQAGNGEEALDVLGRAKIDVVISDIRMPAMDGGIRSQGQG